MKKLVPILFFCLCAFSIFAQTPSPIILRVVTTETATKVRADLIVYNCKDLVSFQFSVNWNDIALTNPIATSSLQSFTSTNVNITTPGLLKVSWIEPSISGIEVASGTPLMSIDFDRLNNVQPNITITSNPVIIEFISATNIIIPYTIIQNNLNNTPIKGRVFLDKDKDCQINTGDVPLTRLLVKASNQQEGNFYSVVDNNGDFNLYVLNPTVPYTLSVEVDSTLWESCKKTVQIQNPTLSSGLSNDFPLKAKKDCYINKVKVFSPFLRRCFSNNYRVNYSNEGSLPSPNTYIVLALDKHLKIETATIPYTSLGTNQYKFDIGILNVSDIGYFDFTAKLSCDSTVIGQTHCVEAEIFPSNDCIEDLGKIKFVNACDNGNVNLIAVNEGVTNLTNLTAIVIEDDMIFKQSVKSSLVPNQPFLTQVPANGSTWRMELRKNGKLLASSFVEGCGKNAQGKFSTGFANQYPVANISHSKSTYCRQSVGSYDPNDKQGLPLGLGTKHYIEQNVPIDYTIRFQNTGTDTAFTVVIEDIIDDKLLDLSSVNLLNTSHNVKLNIKNRNTLVFDFKNIMLPDSFKNEKLSHGYVRFSIAQKRDVPLQSVIKNKAAIFFDFNAAIITNETFHTVGRDFLMVKSQEIFIPNAEVVIRPNPMFDHAILELKGIANEGELRLEIYDLLGRQILTQNTDNQYFEINRNQLNEGLFVFKIYQKEQLLATGKVIVK